MTLLVRDERDIVDYHLRYHLGVGVDTIIVTDHHSVDGTRELLDVYSRKKAVHVIDEPSDEYQQWKWVTRMARMAYSEFGADWVINSDADEFWWTKRADLKEMLKSVPDEFGVISAPSFNFIPVADETKPLFERMVLRHTRMDRLNKLKVCHRGEPDVVVAQGNHRLTKTTLRAHPPQRKLVIFHFPSRSYSQFERKIVNGATAYARSVGLKEDYGLYWQERYREYQQGCLRDYYERHVLTPRSKLLKGLLTRQLVLDRRLSRRLSALPDE